MPAIWMIIASFLFACMGVCVKLGSAQFSTGELVFYRGLFGVVMMAITARLTGTSLATPHWRMQLSRSVSGSLALMCYFFTIGVLPLATAATLSYTSPMFVALILIVLFGEKLRPPIALALLTGFAGVVLLLRPTLQPSQWLGAVTGLGAGMIASLAYISVRELGKAGEPEVRTVFWFSCVTSLLGALWALSDDFHTPDAAGAAALVGVGLFGGLAQLAMTRSYRFGKTIVSAALSYSTVIFASLFGILIWDEHLPAAAWLAVAMIIASGLAVSLASRHKPGD
ncbi:DMT family transporter [Azoarcus sp. L1K30]|uniref:DMT family transporter n=1 Tax=Azoarcus sp. L1K30 TaxID=2820277 RepID=UPI001B818F9B|nr:DMT family transporter [Azoarcus sp. L1K30]MBR0568665.1 DMT family transporter [Azoarcus sp. L1K30]